MKKRFLPLSMLLITMVLAQASMVANAAEIGGKYTPRSESNATISSFWKSIRANQETGLIDPASLIAGQKAAQASRDAELDWEQAGPDNFGGSTRAVIYDNSGNILIGTAGGDIYKTTNNGITFQYMAHVDAPISCLAIMGDVLYIGTGDGFNAHLVNGLDMYDYSTSFVGNGVYKLEGNLMTQVAGTGNAKFVNEMTVVGNDIYAATSEGLMKNWTVVEEGDFRNVKSNNDGDVLAVNNKDVFLAKAGQGFIKMTGNGGLPGNNNNPKIVAMSPTNRNFIYVAFLSGSSGNYKTGNIYFTEDGGDTWQIAYTATTVVGVYAMFGAHADYTGFMAVYPNNERKLLVGSDNLWLLHDATSSGANSYRPTQISEYNCSEFAAIAWNRYFYLHQGIMNIVFKPSDPNTFFIGTEGGIFKGEYYASLYSFKGGNRYFITEDDHSSTARMMSVTVGGTTKVIGGSLDHGTIMMLANDSVDNVTTGRAIFPNVTSTTNTFGYFNYDYSGGPCAISTINPNIMYVSQRGSSSDMPIHRTETNGEDYDLTKFSAEGVITNEAFKTPFALYENYADNHTAIEINELLDSLYVSIDTVTVTAGDTIYLNSNFHVTQGQIWAADTAYSYNFVNINDTVYTINDTSLFVDEVYRDTVVIVDIDFDTLYLAIRNDAKAGDVRHYYSNQGGYPLDYTLPEPPHDSAHIDPAGGYKWVLGDTIWGLHDPLKTNFVCAIKDKVYMTRNALIFNEDTKWFLVSAISGTPSTVTISADGNTAYVGTVGGNFYRFEGIDNAFTAEQADVNDTLGNKVIDMTSNLEAFAGRAITSIAIDPNNANNVLVTLGNYDNDNYVYKSTDGGATFTSIQGNLGRFPVYSSIIEKSSGLYIIGTEHGIYTSANDSTWERSGNITCPVMDLKQAIMANHDDVIDVLYDEMGTPTYIVYPGISNEGMIYAATYGCGIIKCGTYKEGSDHGINEVFAGNQNVMINVYPNPVRGDAQFNFTMSENGNVSYQIFDLAGRMVMNSELGFYGEGEHTATINTENLTSGSYIIRVIAGNTMNTGKFLVY
ncbi:MAG: T9SS type A sorting domain-containing protein [Bacteroidales bacterium]|nr:T9SS type A sorting domain-containing protein [Bacteroidales bacterium]